MFPQCARFEDLWRGGHGLFNRAVEGKAAPRNRKFSDAGVERSWVDRQIEKAVISLSTTAEWCKLHKHYRLPDPSGELGMHLDTLPHGDGFRMSTSPTVWRACAEHFDRSGNRTRRPLRCRSWWRDKARCYERLFGLSMIATGALGASIVAAPLLVTFPAHAQPDTERQKKALLQLSDELAACQAYCQIISRCLAGPKDAHSPGTSPVSQQYAVRARRLRQLAFLFSESAGRADAATSAFIDRVTQNAMQRMTGNCAKVASVVNEHGAECQQLGEHPDDRLELLLKEPS